MDRRVGEVGLLTIAVAAFVSPAGAQPAGKDTIPREVAQHQSKQDPSPQLAPTEAIKDQARAPGVADPSHRETTSQAADPTTPSTGQGAGDAQSGIGDIVVTAQRRSENLQRVPLAVTALSKQDIDNRQIKSTLDAVKFVPNLVSSTSAGQQPGAAAYFLRGIGSTDSIQTIDPPVGAYEDDIYIARQALNNVQAFDVERIEVLRGPQGTLFGKNTTGGAINVVSRRPSNETFVNASAEYGERNHIEVRATANAPIGGNLAVALSGFYLGEDGYYRSRSAPGKFGEQNNFGMRLAADYRPNNFTEWFVYGEYVRVRGLSVVIPSNPAISATSGRAGTIFNSYRDVNLERPECYSGGDPFVWLNDGCYGAQNQGKNLTSNLKIELSPSLSLNFITGYRHTDQDFSADFQGNTTFSVLPTFILTNRGKFNQFSQELKLSGSIFNGQVDLVGGLFYFRERNDTQIMSTYKFPALLGPALTDVSKVHLNNRLDSYAGYIQLDTHITNRMTLVTAGRLTNDNKSVTVDFVALKPVGGVSYHTNDISQPRISSTRFTPKVALQYQATPNIMGYVSATNGFKSGGWNGRASRASGFVPFFDETVWSYEAGVRAALFDRRLRVNATLFRADYKDLQISAVVANSTPRIFATQNAGDSRVQGFELEANALLAKGLLAYFSLGLQDAKFTRVTPGAVASGFSLTSKVTSAPPSTINGGISYQTSLSKAGKLSLAINVTHVPTYNSSITLTTITPTYTPVSGSLGYAAANGRWGVDLVCRNCLRRAYIETPGGTNNALGILPYVGIRLTSKLD